MRQGLKASHTELCRFCIFGNGSANRGPRCYPRPGGGWGLVVGPSVSRLPPLPTPIATWAPTTRTKIDFLQQLCRCLYTGLASQLHGCSALSQRLGTTPMASSDSLEAEPHQYAKGCRHASTTARATVSENLNRLRKRPVQRQLHSSAAATAEWLLFETCPKSLEM